MTSRTYIKQKIEQIFSGYNIYFNYDRAFNEKLLPLLNFTFRSENFEYVSMRKNHIEKEIEIDLEIISLNNDQMIEDIENLILTTSVFNKKTISRIAHEIEQIESGKTIQKATLSFSVYIQKKDDTYI